MQRAIERLGSKPNGWGKELTAGDDRADEYKTKVDNFERQEYSYRSDGWGTLSFPIISWSYYKCSTINTTDIL